MEDWIKIILSLVIGGAGIKWVFDYFVMSRKDRDTALLTAISELTKRDDTAIKMCASLTEQVTMLWGRLDGLEAQLNSWKEKYANLQLEHVKLQKDYEKLKSDYTKLKSEFDKLKKDNI